MSRLSFRTLWSRWFSNARRPVRRSALQLEQLETRTMPAFLGLSSPILSEAPGPNPVNPPTSIAVGDINRDGKIDVVTTGSASSWSRTNQVVVLQGDGQGSEAVTGQLTMRGRYMGNPLLVDLNRDGYLDLVLPSLDIYSWSGTEYSIVQFGGPNGFGGRRNLFYGNSTSATTGDFDGNGTPDLAFLRNDVPEIDLFLNDGQGNLRQVTIATAPSVPMYWSTNSQIESADLNGDGKLDLVWVDSVQRQVRILLNNGDTTFRDGGRQGGFDRDPLGLRVGDVNGDGRTDILVGVRHGL